MFKNFKENLKRKKELNNLEAKKDLDKELVTNLNTQTNSKKAPTLKQVKYLPSVIKSNQWILIQVLIFVAIVGIVVLGFRGYYYITDEVPKVGGEYTEGLVGSPVYINPIFALANDVDADISKLVFSGLYKYNKNQELEADLITNHGLSEDEKTYTFYLREDAAWHDGEPIVADDVVFTFKIIQDSDFRSPLEPSLRGAEVSKIDDYTFNVVLEEPFAPFLSSLTFGILPEHLWFEIVATNARLAELNVKPIGSGPYKFSSLVKDKNGNIKSYQLERFEDYYGNKPYIEKVNFNFYNDVVSLVDGARNKRVSGIAFTPTDLREDLEKNKSLESYNLRLPQYTAVFFNQNIDLLEDDDVRKALAWGFDRQGLVDSVLNGEGEIIYTPILPGYLGYNPEVEKYGYDLEMAKKILDDADWVLLEGDEVRHKDDIELAFTLTTVDQPEYVQAAEILVEEWQKLNIRIELDIVEAAEMQTNIIKPREYEALLFGEIIGTDPDPYPFWHSSQAKHPGLNLAVFFDKKVDQLLEEARKVSDEEERRLKYLHFQNILAEELPAIFLYTPVYTYDIDKEIKGIEDQYVVVPSDRLVGLLDWYIKTDRIW